jgi:hypothetical protein
MVPGVAVAVGVDLVVPHGDALARGVDILHGGGGHNLLHDDICRRGVEARIAFLLWMISTSAIPAYRRG